MQNRATDSPRQGTGLRLKRMLLRLGKALAPCEPYVPSRSTQPEYPPLPEDDLKLERLSHRFSREMFVRLLQELPAYREKMARAFNAGDYRSLRDSVHQILGAAAYCDARELETELRRLRLALRSDKRLVIAVYHSRVINIIDSTLLGSGFRIV